MSSKIHLLFCVGFISILFATCLTCGINPTFLKAYSQQRGLAPSSGDFQHKAAPNSTGKNPYLTITLQLNKDPTEHSSTGEQYDPKFKSLTIYTNDNGENRVKGYLLDNSSRNQVIVSNISIFPTLSFTASNAKTTDAQNTGEISRVFFVSNITRQGDSQLYQGISKFIPITIDNKVYPEPIASFYQYINGTGLLNIKDYNPPIQPH